jgi:hypothetical protein
MDHWKRILEDSPGLEAYLKPIAAKWARGAALPRQMTLGPEPKEPGIRLALDRIFGGRVTYTNGKTKVQLPAQLWSDEQIAALAAQLGIERKSGSTCSDPAIALQRLRLSFPEMEWAHEWLRHAPEIERILRQNPASEQLLRSLLETASFLLETSIPVTLSKLGAQFFNDSKILRGGTLRKLLGGLLNYRLGNDDASELRDIALQQFNVIDNPATTLATLFGPIDLIRNGKKDRWIVDRFNASEPVTLNSYNLQNIEAVGLRPGFGTVITSENAAPFHELVSAAHPAIIIYTGGYPNAAVCRLLRLLALAGATCRHWGDTDPDGFRIAAMVRRHIPVELFRCNLADTNQNRASLIPLNPKQKSRAKQILDTQPEFPFREELIFSLNNGWLEQESTMA